MPEKKKKHKNNKTDMNNKTHTRKIRTHQIRKRCIKPTDDLGRLNLLRYTSEY